MALDKKKVVVGISGGVDSTVAAILLKEQGFNVIGITIKMFEYAMVGRDYRETACCSINSINEGRVALEKMGIPTYVIDIKEIFKEKIMDYFVKEYLNGRTPNPCVMCNYYIKWAVLLKYADALNAFYVATGHYARIEHENERYFIKKGIDQKKDQSYMLWILTQEMLARTLFPLGNLKKEDVRRIAAERGLTRLATKPESYEICFVKEGDYRKFLESYAGIKPLNGIIVDKENNVLGTHKGYWNFTIGQRRGLGIPAHKPFYVIDIIPEENKVVVGEKHDLLKKRVIASNFNLQKYPQIGEPLNVTAKIRYLTEGIPGFAFIENGYLVFECEGMEGVTPGQSLVVYEDEDIVGGGIIL